MRIPTKTQRIQLAPIDLINDHARLLHEQGKHVINMGQGIPGFDPVMSIRDIAEKYLDEVSTHTYSVDAGLLTLRKTLASFLYSQQNIIIDPDTEILITAGANQAFVLTILTLLEPGDRVLLPSPVFFNHAMAIRSIGCEPIEVPLDSTTGFQLHLEDILPYIELNPKMLVIVSPNNPTGAVYASEELKAIAYTLADKNIVIVTDETYSSFTYDNVQHFSLASIPELRSHVVSISTFSKNFCLTGWRIGYLIGEPTFIQHAIKIQDSMIICAPVIAQKTVAEILRNFPARIISERTNVLNQRRMILAETLSSRIPLVAWQPTYGAFYAFVRVNNCKDSRALALDILHKTFVSTIPGNAFGQHGEGYLRLSYGNISTTELHEACDKLSRYFSFISS